MSSSLQTAAMGVASISGSAGLIAQATEATARKVKEAAQFLAAYPGAFGRLRLWCSDALRWLGLSDVEDLVT